MQNIWLVIDAQVTDPYFAFTQIRTAHKPVSGIIQIWIRMNSCCINESGSNGGWILAQYGLELSAIHCLNVGQDFLRVFLEIQVSWSKNLKGVTCYFTTQSMHPCLPPSFSTSLNFSTIKQPFPHFSFHEFIFSLNIVTNFGCNEGCG